MVLMEFYSFMCALCPKNFDEGANFFFKNSNYKMET